MSKIQAYFGTSPQQFIRRLDPQQGWQTLLLKNVAFAFSANSRCDVGEQSSLFASPDSQCIGVFSGKIFGYKSLSSLYPQNLPHSQRLGLILQKLYQQDKLDFPNQLYGFFSIVMFVDNQLLAIRDAIGERSLYVMRTVSGTFIADQMTPLIDHPECTKKLHSGAVSDYLSSGFLPFSRTPVDGISKVLAGTTVSINDHGMHAYNYHQLDDQDQILSEHEAIEQLKSELKLAVDNRFESGYSTALLLSGGLNSSLVGALLGGNNLKAAYTLNFGEKYKNELEFSKLMAKHLRIPNKIVTVSSEMVKAKFLSTAAILDEPMGDPLTIPNIIVAEEAAKKAQVIFNGEGGDPVFGGPKNIPILAFEAYHSTLQEMSREEIYLRSYNKGYENLPTLLSADFIQHVKQNYLSSIELLAPFLNTPCMESYLHRLMFVNIRLKGAGQILPKVFKVATATHLSVRSPLFDRRLVELTFAMPAAMKVKGSIEKYILKQAVAEMIPKKIIARPKSGMLVPVHFWFRRELKSFAHEVLLDRNAKIRYLCDQNGLRDLLKFKGDGARLYFGDRIWLLLSLEFWMQAHNISDTF